MEALLRIGVQTHTVRLRLQSDQTQQYQQVCVLIPICLSVPRSAALCLAQALLKCPVPKSLMRSSDYVGVSEAPATLKETLVAWLLMTDQSEEMEDSSRPHPVICRSVLH